MLVEKIKILVPSVKLEKLTFELESDAEGFTLRVGVEKGVHDSSKKGPKVLFETEVSAEGLAELGSLFVLTAKVQNLHDDERSKLGKLDR